MNYKSCLVLSLGAALLVTGCKKGDTGATGPTGSTGSTGSTGATGPAGTPANVIYSDWITIHQVPIVHSPDESADFASSDFVQVITAPKLTSEIINKGTLLLYFKASDGNVYNSTSSYGVFDKDAIGYFNYYPFNTFSVGKINFFILDNPNLIDRINASGASFRYILIPGVTTSGRIASGTAAGHTIEELKKLPYSEVAKLFNIR